MTRVIIDAGHGGTARAGNSSAFGSRGPSGTLEKDVTLDIARHVVQRLGRGASLTRAGDTNLTLGARAREVVRQGADVFVSIHANSGPPDASGPEVFVHPDAGGESHRLADGVQRALERLRGRYGGISEPRSGAMAVLDPRSVGPATSACLIEVDYLSNPRSEQRLRDPGQRAAIGAAIATAVQEHIATRKTHPAARGAQAIGQRRPGRQLGTGERKRGLVVGINDYSLAGWNNLRNCVNDANAIEGWLHGYGFQVTKLTNQQATGARILSELRSLISQSQAGDSLCFYYSGHGSTDPDPLPGVPNHWAQSLAVADGRKILDRDLANLVGSTADGLNFTIILDSCFSGGMGEAVGVPETLRGLPLPAEINNFEGQSLSITPFGVIDPSFSQTANVSNASLQCGPRPNTTVVPHAKATLFTAVDYRETASDGPASVGNGLYTAALLNVLNHGHSGITNREIQSLVVDEAERLRQQHAPSDEINPMLRAQGSRLDDAFLEPYTSSEYGVSATG
jgi:N-acetylmuramoyl-L-alanine amidase